MTMENFSGIFGQTGWICPKCGRVFSPFTMMCPYCKNSDTNNFDKVISTLVETEKEEAIYNELNV